MNNRPFVQELRDAITADNTAVSEIEMTNGNYDEKGNLIDYKIPTITTDLCEIGSYDSICYFTIIIRSELFTKELFNELTKYPNVHIYGYKNFIEDYYPKEKFSHDEFEAQIHLEEYFQVQFNFDISVMNIADVSQNYHEIANLFTEMNIKMVNQLVERLV